jgi:uncharacterized lipoprotein YehR (DUF1307 family)
MKAMKKIKRIAVVLSALVLMMSLFACGSKNGSVVGTWSLEGTDFDISSMELKDDGTGTIDLGGSITLNITYTTEKDKLTLIMTYLGQTESDEYTYSVKDGKLTLKDSSGNEVVMTKQ